MICSFRGVVIMNIRTMTAYALLIALCAIGGQIHFGVYSIGFDSSPAFVGALMLGPVAGAVLGALGHIATAASTGFPLSVPIHVAIAIIMAGTGASIGYITKRMTSSSSYVVSGIVGYIINVGIGLAVIAWMMQSIEVVAILFVPLSLAYALNYVGAALVVSQLNRVFGGKRHA